jgi:hypothetical protein
MAERRCARSPTITTAAPPTGRDALGAVMAA